MCSLHTILPSTLVFLLLYSPLPPVFHLPLFIFPGLVSEESCVRCLRETFEESKLKELRRVKEVKVCNDRFLGQILFGGF